MNWLVYKNVPPTEYDMIGMNNSASASTLADSPDGSEAKVSAILFDKLHPKKAEMHADESMRSTSTEMISS
jgi:hypothetical protein